MSNFYLGQIGLFGFNFAPRGWALCDGQVLPIAQNTALFSLLGTTYGGNGQSTFALPDLRGRTSVGFGQNYVQGEITGTETVTILTTEMPTHTHPVFASSTDGDAIGVGGHVFAVPKAGNPSAAQMAYAKAVTPDVVFNPQTVTIAGGSQPHNNVQPSLTISQCIATTGIYPSRN